MFELADLHGHCRLTDSTFFRCPTEISMSSQRVEISKLPKGKHIVPRVRFKQIPISLAIKFSYTIISLIPLSGMLAPDAEWVQATCRALWTERK
jgi:hypothetical protein